MRVGSEQTGISIYEKGGVEDEENKTVIEGNETGSRAGRMFQENLLEGRFWSFQLLENERFR